MKTVVPRRRSALWKKAALACGALLVAFVLGEIAVRGGVMFLSRTLDNTDNILPDGSDFTMRDIVISSDNPRLIYELRPNRKGFFLGGAYQSNRFGFRGAEITLEKPPNHWRITTLGDSTMFGWGVDNDASYPAVLERVLNSIGDSVHYEVLNFAVPGYNTATEAESFIARASRFEPDLVILQFDINDLTLPVFVGRSENLWSPRTSYFYSLLKTVLIQRGAMKDIVRMAAPGIEPAPMREVETAKGIVRFHENRAAETPRKYRYMVGWDGIRRGLDRLWENSSQPIVHLSNPFPLENQDVIDVSGGDVVERHIRDAIEKNPALEKRLFYLDITRAGQDFASEIGVNLYADLVKDYPTDLHPAAERHILIAREIYRGLVRMRLLPPDSRHYEKSESVCEAMWNDTMEMWKNRPIVR